MASSKTVVVFILIIIFVSAWIGPSHVVSVNCFRDPKGGYTIVQGIPSSTTSSCSSANHRISCVDSSHPPHKASNDRIAGNAFYLSGYVTRFVFRCILQVLPISPPPPVRGWRFAILITRVNFLQVTLSISTC